MCEECGADNDIAARKCRECKKLLIDPNDKLIGTFLDYKNDLSKVQTDLIQYMRRTDSTSKAGNPMVKVNFGTKYRKFVAFFSKRSNRRFYDMIQKPEFSPKTVSYIKDGDFFSIVDFDRKEDCFNG